MIDRDEENYDQCWWQVQDEEHEQWVADCQDRIEDMREEVKSIW